MDELPKKLKFANKNKTILTVKKHIHNYLKEPIDNIEILCKNFPVADSHSLEYIKKTKWQKLDKTMVLQYRRKKRIMSHANNSKWEPSTTLPTITLVVYLLLTMFKQFDLLYFPLF